jgi:hypothetical protein
MKVVLPARSRRRAERLARLDAQVDAGEAGGRRRRAASSLRPSRRGAARSQSLNAEVSGCLRDAARIRIATPGMRSPASAKAIAMRWSS